MEGQKLYSTMEVAQALGVSDAYIRRLIIDGIAHPIQKIGRAWVFDLAELERLRNRAKSKGGRPKKATPKENHKT